MQIGCYGLNNAKEGICGRPHGWRGYAVFVVFVARVYIVLRILRTILPYNLQRDSRHSGAL